MKNICEKIEVFGKINKESTHNIQTKGSSNSCNNSKGKVAIIQSDIIAQSHSHSEGEDKKKEPDADLLGPSKPVLPLQMHRHSSMAAVTAMMSLIKASSPRFRHIINLIVFLLFVVALPAQSVLTLAVRTYIFHAPTARMTAHNRSRLLSSSTLCSCRILKHAVRSPPRCFIFTSTPTTIAVPTSIRLCPLQSELTPSGSTFGVVLVVVPQHRSRRRTNHTLVLRLCTSSIIEIMTRLLLLIPILLRHFNHSLIHIAHSQLVPMTLSLSPSSTARSSTLWPRYL